MSEWLDGFASALGEAPLEDEEVARLLAVARDVAHRVERKVTPLATFLAGTAAGRSMAGGTPRAEALRSALEQIQALLPEAPEEPTA